MGILRSPLAKACGGWIQMWRRVQVDEKIEGMPLQFGQAR